MDDVEVRAENVCNAPRFEQRSTGLLGRERREHAEGALQAVDRHIRMIIACRGKVFRSRHDTIGIDTVYHLDGVPSLSQTLRELFNEDAVSSKIVGWIESRDHAKAHCPPDSNGSVVYIQLRRATRQ